MRVATVASLVAFACSAPPKQAGPVAPPSAPVATPSAPSAPAPAPAPPPAPAPDATVVRVTLGDVGLEASSLDRTADPCVDFYQFACGGWLETNQIPPDRPRWSRGSELAERVRAELGGLLDDDTRAAAGDALGKKLGDYYASC
ncbi:MAG TPA: hypothetical protein VLX92_32550, partial [Kofleriaceae bacterium]|nr:hypothetical protein [Kofleriaceae bacterium]